MTKIFSQGHDIIKIQFPQKKFESLLAKLRISPRQKLSTENTRKTFLLSIEEFQAGVLALDEMSEIAEKLWSDVDDKSTELADAILACAELNFYVRRIVELEDQNSFIFFMKEVMNFFEKTNYKNQQNDKPR